MRRREFAKLVAATVSWPMVAGAQQRMPVIGFLHSGVRAAFERNIAGFRKGLTETGYIEGKNVRVEYRWADGRYDRLREFAAELVRLNVNLLIGGSAPAAVEAKAATGTIPIVFNSGVDPIKLGLVESLNRPGANLTGTYILVGALAAKRLGLLRDLIATDAVIGVLLNPKNASAAEQLDDVEAAAAAIGRQVLILRATNAAEIDEAFAAMATARTGAALVGADPFFLGRRQQIVALAARHTMPAIYEFREFVDAGGLISYGPSLPEAYRQVGTYAGRVLNGERPADLPVVQPTRFELVINLETAKTLGLAIPQLLLARADEVIE